MISLHLPAFGETSYADLMENNSARVIRLDNVPATRFTEYCCLLEANGFVLTEQQILPHRSYAAFQQHSACVFVNYFVNTAQLQLVLEENCAYFGFSDTAGPICTTPRLTQVYLEDYGLSDVIRLSDGRLIVIDGADIHQSDVDGLLARIMQDSPFDKPVIAAWIMTHAHSDHFFCFFPFIRQYGNQVTIEKMLFNFPSPDDVSHYPKIIANRSTLAKFLGAEQATYADSIRLFCDLVSELGIPVYMPHTGQHYQIGDAYLQFFSSIDDTIGKATHMNTTSLMFTMKLAGQTIFFAADGSFGAAQLADRYGVELKSDILQVPHHGFGSGPYEEQIRGYRLIAPRVCLLPVAQDLAYTSFTTYREGTAYLMNRLDIDEMLTGEKEHTLELPYTPDPDGKAELRERFIRGRDDSGARTWIFSDLCTANAEDFLFSVLNTTYLPASITVELYFENDGDPITRFCVEAAPLRISPISCVRQDIPENTGFAVRFLSNKPVVITHKKHPCAYRSSVI